MLSFLGKHALQPGVPDPDAWVRDLVRVLDRAEVRARRHVRPPARARSPPCPSLRGRYSRHRHSYMWTRTRCPTSRRERRMLSLRLSRPARARPPAATLALRAPATQAAKKEFAPAGTASAARHTGAAADPLAELTRILTKDDAPTVHVDFQAKLGAVTLANLPTSAWPRRAPHPPSRLCSSGPPSRQDRAHRLPGPWPRRSTDCRKRRAWPHPSSTLTCDSGFPQAPLARAAPRRMTPARGAQAAGPGPVC